ncbi:MAG: N-acetylneuraminate lyase [Solirubrobacteraceae bacterium]|jgi:dihydrodipicolinate synthase/N-acetylneuraminate lyase|nr:N-acetylneuraminate lyase [Solirubrobacteraceae bacterium]
MSAGGPLGGVVAATVTPLRDGGQALDRPAVARLTEFLREAGATGVFVAGTTGEGLLLDLHERMALAEQFLEDAGGLRVAIHAGAQTTADAVRLAEHARDAGAAAVAAVAPPFYRLDDAELAVHFAAVAGACAPVPFYLYEFAARAGYAIPPRVVRELQDRVGNLAGMKVSDPQLQDVEAYLLPGLDLLVGSEALIPDALALGAVGAVSGLAAAFPRTVVRVLEGAEPPRTVASLRAALARHPFQAALKTALVDQGVLSDASVRAPLRGLTASERSALAADDLVRSALR